MTHSPDTPASPDPALAEVLARTRAILGEVPPQIRVAAIAQLSPATPEGDAISREAEEDGVTRAVIAKLRNGLIKSCSPSGKRVAFDGEKTRGLMIVAADRLDAQLTRISDHGKRIAELESVLADRGAELTAAWHQLAGEALQNAAYGLRRIVEEIDGAMNHGTWRDERDGARLKDTPEWVAFYNALASLTPKSADLGGEIEGGQQQLLTPTVEP